jgi:hypothetical protein
MNRTPVRGGHATLPSSEVRVGTSGRRHAYAMLRTGLLVLFVAATLAGAAFAAPTGGRPTAPNEVGGFGGLTPSGAAASSRVGSLYREPARRSTLRRVACADARPGGTSMSCFVAG